MKNTLFLVLAVLGIQVWGYGQSAKTANSLLWEITGKELAEPSYLYGTIHMIPKADYFLTEETKTALEKAKKVTFEIDMDKMNDISALMPMMMKAFMANDTTLSDLLTEEEYKVVDAHFKKLGLPMFMLNKIKPLFLSALVSEDALSLNGPDPAIVSYEFELMKLAKAKSIDVDGLETPEFQMSVFDSIPYKAQAKMLVDAIESGGGENDEFDKMVQMYKSQDIEGMHTMIQGDEGGLANYEELLLIKRNENWIPIMTDMMLDGTTFFAVGAGHLGGKKGVIQLLEEAGYQLKPLHQ